MEFIERLPPARLDKPRKNAASAPDKSTLYRQHAAAVKELETAKKDVDSLIKNADDMRRIMGSEYGPALERRSRASEAARAEVDRLQELLDRPGRTETLTLLRAIEREGGIGALWEGATLETRRGIVSSIVKRIHIARKANSYDMAGLERVEWQEWVTAEGLDFPIPPEWIRTKRQVKR